MEFCLLTLSRLLGMQLMLRFNGISSVLDITEGFRFLVPFYIKH